MDRVPWRGVMGRRLTPRKLERVPRAPKGRRRNIGCIYTDFRVVQAAQLPGRRPPIPDIFRRFHMESFDCSAAPATRWTRPVGPRHLLRASKARTA